MSKKTEGSHDQGFIKRWSRKKAESARPEEIENDPDITLDEDVVPAPAPAQPEGEAIAGANPDEENAGKPVLCDDDMPPVECLTEDSDYSGFMSPGVSQKLRQVALRKLFASAGFNIRDGLDDYDEDFRNFAPLGDIVTCDMKHQIEMAEKRKREAEEERLAKNVLPTDDEAGAAEDDEHTVDEDPADDDMIAEEIDETSESDQLVDDPDDEDEPVKS